MSDTINMLLGAQDQALRVQTAKAQQLKRQLSDAEAQIAELTRQRDAAQAVVDTARNYRSLQRQWTDHRYWAHCKFCDHNLPCDELAGIYARENAAREKLDASIAALDAAQPERGA